MNSFLPISAKEIESRGWKEIDILLVSGDAYIDHPSSGTAIIGRILESAGYKVALLCQPNWRSLEDFLIFGRPRLCAGVTAGALDSMLAHYTAAGKPRRSDSFSPGGISGLRPNRASIVYANRVREAFPGLPIILGGIEASMRRLSHYDYWSNSVRRSILLDSRTHWIAYGMAESAMATLCKRLAQGESPDKIHDVPGTVWVTGNKELLPKETVILPSEEEVMADKKIFAESFRIWYMETCAGKARPIAQPSSNRFVVQIPPEIEDNKTLDKIYSLPFTGTWHPSYEKEGGVPALKTFEHSITSHRGCVGGCAFCSLSAHQGKAIRSRSKESILAEVKKITASPNFRGTITDIGGPTANMYGASCKKGWEKCSRTSCLSPKICENLILNGKDHLALLESALQQEKVKHVFVSTGIRHDIVLSDPCKEYLSKLCSRHISGQMKIAPEHISNKVLSSMRKSNHATFTAFLSQFERVKKESRKELYLLPYFMSGHPGCTIDDMLALAEFLHRWNYFPEQVQDFIPLPMTLSGAMYWTGIDPLTKRAIHIPKESEKRIQRALLQPTDPKNKACLQPFLKKRGKTWLLTRKKKSLP